MLKTPPTRTDAVPPPALIEALAEEAAAYPFDRKILVCRRLGDGREVLRALAMSGTPWIGFEATTPRGLAHELMAPRLAELGLRSTDEFDELALLDDSVDAVLAQGGGARLRDLAEGAGFRQAIANAVSALRLAGIDADTLQRVPLRDAGKRDALVRILGEYERRLERLRRVDGVAVFRLANQALSAGTVALPPARIHLFPAQDRRGLSGRLLELIVERGARVLPAETVAGLTVPAARLPVVGAVAPPARTRLACLHDIASASGPGDSSPPLSLFAAASIQDELREVLRRIVAARLPWDTVEIITTDALTYGAALDGLAQRLRIPVTYAAGLPLERTRPGRAVAGYLRWIQEDFPEDVIRGLLERGDVVAPGEGAAVDGAGLARRLRRMRIGRGRERYETALARAERWVDRPRDDEDDRQPDEISRARAQEREQVRALGAVLRPILAATPALPDRLGLRPLLVRPADLARGARALLARVPARSPIDIAARSRLLARLERLEETATRATTLGAAIAVLTSRLDTRVPAPDTGGTAPWNGAGGHLHLSDLDHGGFTGRRATFIVGLDAARFPGGGLQDPLLVDDDRHRLNTGQVVGSMPTSADRLMERRYAFAELLARLRGRVTLSYSAWDAAEARTVPPAAEMLQAFRLLESDVTADYDRMHTALAAVASAVPRGERLDGADVWLAALDRDGVMREGRRVVCNTYGGLGRGLRAASARRQATLGPHQGLIQPRRAYDPRDNADIVVSSSRLESLGACPRRYLLRYVLNVRPPDDPELEPDRWLSPRDRGALLHTVFEGTLQAARTAGIATDDEPFLECALGLLDRELAAWRDRLPPAGDAVYHVEAEGLRDDVRAFVRMVRQDGPDWVGLERKFGRDGAPPVTLALPAGAITLAGAIDRIDQLRDGAGLVIIDYKTGGTFDYRRDTGIYRGGRRLQHVLYAAVAEQLYGAAVARAEYHFPTVKGRAERAVYLAEELRAGLDVVDRLLSIAARGHFFPTDAADDCRWCDYRAVCRVKVEGSRVVSPAADWSARVARDAGELHVMRELRKSP